MRTAFVSLFVAVAALGCTTGDLMFEDAAVRRDAALQEGGVIPTDAGASDAGGGGDGAVDAGAVLACTGGDCDPRAPGACGEDAGACVLRDRLPVCLPTTGDGEEGASCVDEEDCAPTLACFREGSEGVCGRVCCPGEVGGCGDAADTTSYCRADGTLVGGVTTSWGRCSPLRACDVLEPELVCSAKEGCYVEPGVARAVCRYAGTGAVGTRCERQTDCSPGFFCGGVPVSTCVRICRLDDSRSCPELEGRCVAQAYSPPGSGVCVATSPPR